MSLAGSDLFPPLVVERLVRVAPLGIRFFDPASRRYIADLVVDARPIERPRSAPLHLYANPSGVFVLHGGVSAVRDFEATRAALGPDEDFWSGWPTPGTYRLTVADPQQRFITVSVQVDVPSRGLAVWDSGLGSPLEPLDGQPYGDPPLFSAAWRPSPEGLAALRADLFDPIARRPAAWAIVEVRYNGRLLGRGMASRAGQMIVLFPYPPPRGVLPDSPPDGPPSPPVLDALLERTWTVDIRIAYTPGAVELAEAPIPDLNAALAQLSAPPAVAWADAALTTPLDQATLHVREDLVLRTAAASPPAAGAFSPSYLLVTSGGSPP